MRKSANLLRNLAYASIIVAAFTFTIHQFNRPAEAFAPTLAIYGNIIGVDQNYVLLDDGRIFHASWTGWQEHANLYPLPLSSDQIEVFSHDSESNGPLMIDTFGRGWARGPDGQWYNIGSLPGFSPTPTENTTWGAIKARGGK